MNHRFSERWHGPGGYREVLAVAIPLVLATGTTSILHFVDNVFLTWYSADALSAAMPGALMSLSMFAFFTGTISFVNTFVAQYDGNKRPQRIGAALWQGIWLSVATAVLFAVTIPFIAKPIFDFIGHAPEVRKLEIDYFIILGSTAGFPVYMSAIAAFYSGRGKSWPLAWVNFFQVILNIILDYIMIFGKLGLPAMGIRGAALATVISLACGCLTMTILVMSPENTRRFATRSSWRIDLNLMRRLLRFGIPNGLQFGLDIGAFTTFILLIGRLGKVELAATNLTFRVNLLLFLPMIGFGIACSALVGRYLGSNKPDLSERATWSTFHITVTYMVIFAFFYIVTPRWFIAPFAAFADPGEFEEIMPLAISLMRFIAVYSLFDTMQVIFSSSLRGAGDTRFAMYYSVTVLWLCLVLPVFVIIKVGGSLYHAWVVLTCAILILGTGMFLRFRGGKWREMRVIEDQDHLRPGPIVISDEEAVIVGEVIHD